MKLSSKQAFAVATVIALIVAVLLFVVLNKRGRPAQEIEIGDARAVDPLLAALGDDDEGVRARAAKTLGEIGDPAHTALPRLQELSSRDPNEDARDAARRAMNKIE